MSNSSNFSHSLSGKVFAAFGDKCQCGDFAKVLAHVLKDRASTNPSHKTLADVNNFLDDLVAANKTSKRDLIVQNINAFSAVEHAWLMRIVLGDLKVGFKEACVLGYLSKGKKVLLDRFNVCVNLRATVDEFDPSTGNVISVSSLLLTPMTTFKPMLADKSKMDGHGLIAGVEKMFKDQSIMIDLKLDGERLLVRLWPTLMSHIVSPLHPLPSAKVHVADGKVKVFSRRGTDYTDLYASIAAVVKANVNVSTCILDGEVLAWDENVSLRLRHAQTCRALCAFCANFSVEISPPTRCSLSVGT